MKTTCLCLVLVFLAPVLVTAKPIYGPIALIEKQKVQKFIRDEEQALDTLKEEQALMEKVLENMDRQIEKVENGLETLKSMSKGNLIIDNILADYNKQYSPFNTQFRPG